MKLNSAGLLLFLLVSCAPKPMSSEEGRAVERLPTPGEVIAYVRAHWVSDYGKRYAKFADRPDGNPELIEITNVRCNYYVVTPECSFDALARFADDEPQRRQMFEQFGWTNDGQLKSVLVTYHMHRR